jgi:hypothetical protein
VVIDGITASAPTAVSGAGGKVRAVPIVLLASGSPAKLNSYLDELQQKQPRAVLISSATLTEASVDGESSDRYSLSLSLQAFVASATAASGTGAPAGQPTTKTN